MSFKRKDIITHLEHDLTLNFIMHQKSVLNFFQNSLTNKTAKKLIVIVKTRPDNFFRHKVLKLPRYIIKEFENKSFILALAWYPMKSQEFTKSDNMSKVENKEVQNRLEISTTSKCDSIVIVEYVIIRA